MNTPLESEPERISQQPRAMPRHALVASVSRGPVPSGWAEVRLDAWWPTPPDAEQATDDLLRLLGARGGATNAGAPHGQLIATLRPTRQGGAFTGPEKIRLGLLVAAAQAGFGAVDVEADLAHAGAVVRVMHQSGARVILSDHALTAVPSREDGLQRLLAMQDAGADVEKLAFPAVSFADGLRALELAYAHAERGGNPCVVPHGMSAAWRALLAVAGNRLSYGHAHGSPPAVPGQPAAADVADVLHHWGLDDASWQEASPQSHRHEPWYAVLGHPVAHSLSPHLHNAALQHAGRRQRYGALDVPDSDAALRLVQMVAHRLGLAGASVTTPHKQRALRLARPDPIAAAVGAANALRFLPDGAEATNTDATAFARLLQESRRVVVLGAGGAARAALWAARQVGSEPVLCSRDEARGRVVAEALDAAWVPWAQAGAQRGDTWVQATPNDAALAEMPGARLYIQLDYRSPVQAPTAGDPTVRVVTGKEFLLEQAVDAYAWWFGEEPDRQAMHAVLQREPRGGDA
jgi:3-dehydroquinate dehydratase / shikimate dehydrogenase